VKLTKSFIAVASKDIQAKTSRKSKNLHNQHKINEIYIKSCDTKNKINNKNK